MGLFGSKPSILGVDIGTASVKAVLLRKQDGTFQLGALGENVLRTNYLHGRGEQFISETVNSLTQLFAQMRLKSKDLRHIVVGIPGNLAFSTVISVPDGSWQQLNQAVFSVAEKYIPADIDTVSLSWAPLQTITGPNGQAQREIYLVAFSQEVLAIYQQIISQVGNKAPLFELNAFAQARATIGSDQVNTLLVDIGSDVSEISIIEQGIVRLNRIVNTGSRMITERLMDKLSMEASEAEKQKREMGLDRANLLETVPSIVQTEVDKIALEIDRIRKRYIQTTQKNIERLIVLGGGGHIRDLDYYLGRKLNLASFAATPWQRVSYDKRRQKALLAKGSDYATAIGLAMYPIS
ncbi:type IV pilus assembly protein PilM [Patescibacteria group bacterium]